MKTFILTSLVIILISAGCAKPPSQGSPHFVGRVTAILAKDQQSVLVAWKEAGLGDNQLVEYQVTADGSSFFVCVTNSGNCPNAENKHPVAGPVISTVTLSSGQNGQIDGSAVLFPPESGDASCPGGQTLTFTEFSLTNIQVTDVTNNVTAVATPDSLSTTLFVCP